MLGNPAMMLAIISPSIPVVGIRRKPRGRPIASVSMLCLMSIFVSPKPERRLPELRLPTAANRLLMAYMVRKKGP